MFEGGEEVRSAQDRSCEQLRCEPASVARNAASVEITPCRVNTTLLKPEQGDHMKYRYSYQSEHIPFIKEQIWESRSDLDLYSALSEFEHEQIKDYIGRPKRVMDLGCGLGRVAVYLNAVWNDPDVHYVLADTTCTTKVPECWDSLPDAPWNDLAMTASFARLNGLVNFAIFDIVKDDWTSLPPLDLITSHCSVGMHFPIETILPQLMRVASDDGTLIFGVRAKPHYASAFKHLFHEIIWLPQPACGNFPQQDWLVLKRKKSKQVVKGEPFP